VAGGNEAVNLWKKCRLAQNHHCSILTGNLSRPRWYGSYEDAEEKDLIPRIKPLKHVREEEIALYAYYHNLPLMELEYPYVQGALWTAPSR
jgi:tRNA(Ile)-lysidine synthase TilS/MesJ